MSILGETMSDSSDSTIGHDKSFSYHDDIQEIMNNLGIPSLDLLTQERFKVDKKLLGKQLFANGRNPGSDLFLNIMKETRTHIYSGIKTKSKKNLHITVMGRQKDVKVAHEKIMEILEPKVNRVRIKIDVSYTDHSHMIGKGGLSIKKVMEETKCHIHFPDSNRSNPFEKSNQVSIAGDVQDVEKARAKVRELTPLIFCFELPILEALTPEQASSYINVVQRIYNVHVMSRTIQKLNSTLVVIKGCEQQVEKVKEATAVLMAHMCKSLTDQIQATVEISPHLHKEVLGQNNENIKQIMINTKTKITFVDQNDPNIPCLKKSSVTITGSINDVYVARQQLIGSLPVLFVFDVPKNSPALEKTKISDTMSKYNVTITTKNKYKHNDIIMITIKGIERNIGDIYEAYRYILDLNDPPVHVQIPPHYFIRDFSWKNVESAQAPKIPDVQLSPSKPEINKWSQHLKSPIQQRSDLCQFSYSTPSLPGLLQSPDAYSVSSNASVISNSRTASPLPEKKPELKRKEVSRWEHTDFLQKEMHTIQSLQKEMNTYPVSSPSTSWHGYQGLDWSSPSLDDSIFPRQKRQKLDTDWPNSSGEFSSDCDCSLKDSSLNKVIASPNVINYMSQAVLSTVMKSPMINDLSSFLVYIGLEKYTRFFELQDIDFVIFTTLTDQDLEDIGITAVGARIKLLRFIDELNKRWRRIDWNGNEKSLNGNDEFQSICQTIFSNVINWPMINISSILSSIGLEEYLGLLESQEVDLIAFMTLSEQNLKDIGIASLGARRKILLCIEELNKKWKFPFQGCAAPGAKRVNSCNALTDWFKQDEI